MSKTTATLLYKDEAIESLAAGLIGAWSWDITNNVVYADKTVAGFFALSKSAVKTGLPIERFIDEIHPNDRNRVKKNINEALKSHQEYRSEYRIVDKTGRECWVIARGRVESSDDGKTTKLLGVIIDITDRKKAELKQAEVEKRLIFMADSMPQLVWIANPDGEVEYYNKRWYDFTGSKAAESKGDGWQNLLHPDDRQKAADVWRSALRTGKPYEVQYRLFYASNRTYRWVIGRAMPYKNEKDETINWYGTCTDIDEQKHAAIVQTFLAKASKRLASSLNYIKTLKAITELSVPHVADWCSVDLFNESGVLEQVAVSHIDPKRVSQAIEYRQLYPVDLSSQSGLGKVIRSKKTEFYPYIDEEIVKSSVKDKQSQKLLLSLNLRSLIITPIIDRQEVIGAITFVLSDTPRYFSRGDVKMAEKIAARVALAIANAKLYEASLREIQARKKLEKDLIAEQQKLELRVTERTKQLNMTNQGLVEEIRRRREAEEELKAYSEELSRSNQELQDFAYVASHDLQEPLRKIQAFGDILRTEYSDTLGDGVDYLNRMLGAASRMSSLIHDLLSFSRVSTKNSPSIKVDLNSVVADVLIDLEAAIDDEQGQVNVAKLPSVHADPTHMRQLFQNLISNALKFHRPGVRPKIDITSRNLKSNQTEIRVADNGIGFDDKYSEKIFSVFQRLHGREAYNGTGIGLAVCRKIVQRYGGTIAASSKAGEGSVFIIRLPRKITSGGRND